MAKQTKKSDRETKTHRRAFWSGTISFALVNVPVELFPASRSSGISFRLLDQDGTPLKRRYYCPEHGNDVHPEHILRGYPIDKDDYVIVRDEELDAIEPRKSREIDLRRFVDIREISPALFHRTYFMTPRGDTNKAYRLLADVLERSERAGIATFVMRDREYVVAIMAEHGILRAVTLRFEDEIRSPETIGLPAHEKPGREKVAMFEKQIQKHSVDELPADWLADHYSQRVRSAAEKKRRAGEQVHVGEAAVEKEIDSEPKPHVDLLETIRQSLQQTSAGEDGSASSHASSPYSTPLDEMTKEELYELAQRYAIKGRSKMDKSKLIKAIKQVV